MLKTSIVDALVYPAKLYLLTQLANVVMKLSRSSTTRKWTIEAGSKQQHGSLLQKLVTELRNQRVTVNDLISMKSIPRILSD